MTSKLRFIHFFATTTAIAVFFSVIALIRGPASLGDSPATAILIMALTFGGFFFGISCATLYWLKQSNKGAFLLGATIQILALPIVTFSEITIVKYLIFSVFVAVVLVFIAFAKKHKSLTNARRYQP